MISRRLVPFDKNRFLLNGVSLGSYGLFAGPNGIVPDKNTTRSNYVSVPGMNADYDNSLQDYTRALYRERRNVSLDVGTVGLESDIYSSIQSIASLDGTVVYLRDNALEGSWGGRLSVDVWNFERNSEGCLQQATTTLTVAAYPFLKGDAEQIPFTAGTSFSYELQGTHEVYPTLSLVLATAASVVTVTNSVGDMLQINPSGSFTSGTRITIDMSAQTVTVNGNPWYNISIASDFFPMQPGRGTIKVNSQTSLSIVYQPEWSF